MNLLQTALYWSRMGYSTIPIGYRSKKPILSTWEPYQKNPPSDTELKLWFTPKLRNIALVISNGLVIIDFDIRAVFDYWFSMFPIKTYMVETSRGIHVYIKTKEQAKNFHSLLLDVKAERGYVLIPPSIHPNGHEYKVYKQAAVLEVNRLEDVLPKSFTPESERVVTVAQYDMDPWEMADHPIEKDSVDRIRSSISILELLPDAVPSGGSRWYVTLCPFHEDRNPSFWIDTKRGLCGCRKCNLKEMDVINLYARINNIDNAMAIRKLYARVNEKISAM